MKNKNNALKPKNLSRKKTGNLLEPSRKTLKEVSFIRRSDITFMGHVDILEG
jgi:hypothetical protein